MIRTARVTAKAAGSVEEALREAQDLFNVTKNLVHGTRAHDEGTLALTDSRRAEAPPTKHSILYPGRRRRRAAG